MPLHPGSPSASSFSLTELPDGSILYRFAGEASADESRQLDEQVAGTRPPNSARAWIEAWRASTGTEEEGSPMDAPSVHIQQPEMGDERSQPPQGQDKDTAASLLEYVGHLKVRQRLRFWLAGFVGGQISQLGSSGCRFPSSRASAGESRRPAWLPPWGRVASPVASPVSPPQGAGPQGIQRPEQAAAAGPPPDLPTGQSRVASQHPPYKQPCQNRST